MCNLYAALTTQDEMRRVFKIRPDLDFLGNFAPLAGIFPRFKAPVIRLTAGGEREVVSMSWGFLLPQTSKVTGEPIKPKPVNNARDDKLDTPFWRSSFEARRCLVPATAFCETKGKKPATFVWFAVDADNFTDRPVFAFAGLWRRFNMPEGPIDTFTVITTTPNALVQPVHPDRMPVVLSPEDYDTWLKGSVVEARALLRPFPADKMRIIKEVFERQEP